jgi:hypothetical protein
MPGKFDDLPYASCEVKSLSNQLIAVGYICKAGDHAIEIRPKSNKLPLQSANSKVKIILQSKKNGYKTLVGTVYLSTNDMMRVIDLQEISDFEKRKYFRIVLQLEAVALKPAGSDEEEENAAVIPVTIMNVSLRGLHFKSVDPFQVNDKITVIFPAPGKTLRLPAKICRITGQGGEAGYGCSFIDISRTDLDVLYKFILSQELNSIKNRAEQYINSRGNRLL